MNAGLKESQKQNRFNTLNKIATAVAYLRENRLPINKSAIAREAGLSQRVMYKDHVVAYLETLLEFNSKIVSFDEIRAQEIAKIEIDKYASIIKKKEKMIQSLAEKNAALEIAYKKLKAEFAELQNRHRHLLADYMNNVGKNNTIKL